MEQHAHIHPQDPIISVMSVFGSADTHTGATMGWPMLDTGNGAEEVAAVSGEPAYICTQTYVSMDCASSLGVWNRPLCSFLSELHANTSCLCALF